MDYRPIAPSLYPLHPPPALPLAQLQLIGRLLLCNLPLTCLMQDLQPVSFPLAHRQPVLSHPDLSLSSGHFYFAATVFLLKSVEVGFAKHSIVDYDAVASTNVQVEGQAVEDD